MDFDIYFCADGILRAKFNDNKPMIPIKFLQDNGNYKGNDFRFWACWWECNTYFEADLTVGKFLSCLEPWGEFWSDFIGKDIISYIKESRHPIAVIDKEHDEKPLTWVSLAYHTDLSPISEYLDNESFDDILEENKELLNQPRLLSRLTGEWEIYSSYKVSGFAEGQEEQYSIDFSPMNKLVNLPIVLSDKHVLYFSNWKLNQILGSSKDQFFQENAFGLCSIKDGFTKFVIGNKTHNIRDIVKGFFLRLQSSSTNRNNSVDAQQGYWEEMLEKAYRQNNVILKIGKTKEAKAPEKRVFNYIINDDNDPAHPKPSKYKLW
jgi:hypothetical protein